MYACVRYAFIHVALPPRNNQSLAQAVSTRQAQARTRPSRPMRFCTPSPHTADIYNSRPRTRMYTDRPRVLSDARPLASQQPLEPELNSHLLHASASTRQQNHAPSTSSPIGDAPPGCAQPTAPDSSPQTQADDCRDNTPRLARSPRSRGPRSQRMVFESAQSSALPRPTHQATRQSPSHR